MTKRKPISRQRLILFSFLFLSWYGMLALLCWNIVAMGLKDPVNHIGEAAWIKYVFLNGVVAGMILFFLTLFKFNWKTGNWKQFFWVCMDFVVLISMTPFPFYILSDGYYLVQRFDPLLILAGIVIFTFFVSARCLSLIKRQGEQACAL